MTDFLFIFFATHAFEDDAAIVAHQTAWQAWYKKNASQISDVGAPIGTPWTIDKHGTHFRGRQPASTAYMIIKAENRNAAFSIAAANPDVQAGGSVEVAEIHRIAD
ncbi:MAG: hypothetical protein QNJ20_15285 [Paracoccaceae bacterium]|nr:hypothetical protein [Paracoccaceae bacterium]